MGWCKKDVTPLLAHWSYVFLALTHQDEEACTLYDSPSECLNSLAPGRCWNNFEVVLFKFILGIGTMSISGWNCLQVNATKFHWWQATLVQKTARCCQAPSQCWPNFMMPRGIIWVQWVNTLWPSEAIWCHRTWSTLVQVIVCRLTVPRHYLDQSWLIISEWDSPKGNFRKILQGPLLLTWFNFNPSMDK